MSQVDAPTVVASREDGSLSTIWLEITGRCNLECSHCYANSGPGGDPDRVGTGHWLSLLEQAAELAVERVIFIGGEPTLHADFDKLVSFAVDCGLNVEVFTNLTHIKESQWEYFRASGVSLATSFYSLRASVHDRVTHRVGSQVGTAGNIRRALSLGIPIRVGLVDVLEGQDLTGTSDYLRGLGVTDVWVDRSREVGRGTAPVISPVDALCGHCAEARLAVDPSGQVYPCVFARWLRLGDAREMSLGELDRSALAAQVRAELRDQFQARTAAGSPTGGPCSPNVCGPRICGPDRDPGCIPGTPCFPLGG